MIADKYEIWVCPVCDYWAADNSHEDLYHPKHLSEHAGLGKFVPLTSIIVKPEVITPTITAGSWQPVNLAGNTVEATWATPNPNTVNFDMDDFTINWNPDQEEQD